MTWEEAKAIIKDLRAYADDEGNGREVEALDMAIEAMDLATHFAVRLGKDAEGPVGDWIHEVHEAALTIAKVTRVAGHEPWGDEDA